MTSSNPYLERAKQGDPDAIAYLMRRSLQSKGIDVSAQDEGDTLLVTLEGAQPVNREAVVAFIRKGMHELDISSLRSVQVDWRQQGSLLSEWTEEIVLADKGGMDFGSASLSSLDEPTDAPPSIDDMDLPEDDGGEVEDMPDLAPGGMDLDDMDGDLMDNDEPMEMADEEPTAEKKKPSTSPLVLLLLLAALLGGGWYFYREGYFDSVIAQLPDSVRQYFPPSTGAVPTDPDVAADPGAPVDGETPAEGESPAPVEGETPAAAESPAPADGAAPAESPAAAESPVPAESPEAAESPAASPSPAAAASPAPAAVPQSPEAAPAEPSFNVGVREAIRASNLTQSAQTPAQWSAVATAWQGAVDAMKKVPQTDANYATAQDRIPTYEKNLAYAKSNAQ